MRVQFLQGICRNFNEEVKKLYSERVCMTNKVEEAKNATKKDQKQNASLILEKSQLKI